MSSTSHTDRLTNRLARVEKQNRCFRLAFIGCGLAIACCVLLGADAANQPAPEPNAKASNEWHSYPTVSEVFFRDNMGGARIHLVWNTERKARLKMFNEKGEEILQVVEHDDGTHITIKKGDGHRGNTVDQVIVVGNNKKQEVILNP